MLCPLCQGRKRVNIVITCGSVGLCCDVANSVSMEYPGDRRPGLLSYLVGEQP